MPTRCSYGLIGRPLGHSFSPRYFSELFDCLGIDASYDSYELQRIEELPELLATHPSLRGLNVTLPYKREVLRYVDACSPEVEHLQAANVLCMEHTPSGKRHITAHNTDVWGFYHSLLPFLERSDLMLGSSVREVRPLLCSMLLINSVSAMSR